MQDCIQHKEYNRRNFRICLFRHYV